MTDTAAESPAVVEPATVQSGTFAVKQRRALRLVWWAIVAIVIADQINGNVELV